MMAASCIDFQQISFNGIRGSLRRDEAMSRHTSWRVGGVADLYFVPQDVDDLKRFLRQLPVDVGITWTGLGSNLLVRDGGIRGVVIATQKGLNRLEKLDPLMLQAEAGVTGAKVARFGASVGLTGAEFMAGIPGTVGGALAMNAGAWGSDTWSIVAAVDTIDRSANVRERSADEFKVAYRQVDGPANEFFLAARFRLAVDDDGGGLARIKKLLDERSESQPVQSANAGSVFRNPDGDYAARLIESCGLKGHRIGDASVSEKHANFIINDGNASAADIETLISHIIDVVSSRTGVELHPEVRVMGEARQ